jgi:hypothetical protein
MDSKSFAGEAPALPVKGFSIFANGWTASEAPTHLIVSLILGSEGEMRWNLWDAAEFLVDGWLQCRIELLGSGIGLAGLWNQSFGRISSRQI